MRVVEGAAVVLLAVGGRVGRLVGCHGDSVVVVMVVVVARALARGVRPILHQRSWPGAIGCGVYVPGLCVSWSTTTDRDCTVRCSPALWVTRATWAGTGQFAVSSTSAHTMAAPRPGIKQLVG